MALRVGLNPYGLTYTLGLQGQGTPRVNPRALGLDGFVAIAHEHGAQVVEIDWRWLLTMPAAALETLRDDLAIRGVAVIVSAWPMHRTGETLNEPIRVASALGARLLRLHLMPVLEGARAALGPGWREMVSHARTVLADAAGRARDIGLELGVEDHQDFGSEELLEITGAAGDNVGIVFDTGNPFAVGEDPVAFARRVRAQVVHLHIKDYRTAFTDEGFKLIRCAIGDGAVPLSDILAVVDDGTRELTASIEPAALEARHIRLFTPEWWHSYPPREAAELGVLLGRLRRHQVPADGDHRTPWELGAPSEAIVAYEREQVRRGFDYVNHLLGSR
jgi:3-oxoisoapionate decarboxylase